MRGHSMDDAEHLAGEAAVAHELGVEQIMHIADGPYSYIIEFSSVSPLVPRDLVIYRDGKRYQTIRVPIQADLVIMRSDSVTLGELICNKLNCVKPRIVCLCGSTRFTDAYTAARRRETIAGHIVLSSDVDTHNGEHLGDADAIKYRLDMLHLSKIDLADEVLVLNVNRYIGNSTRLEILYAQALNKPLRYLETH